ncbi:hypothetical protein lerEdw1_013483 [Lerista edwardsae]|nr:hypothetical protein lerEdw1_013485 [Lerista edwardsae]KAJ6650238.1 hypothetical protein lerEdw1_013483 [Lerista edwardsae]
MRSSERALLCDRLAEIAALCGDCSAVLHKPPSSTRMDSRDSGAVLPAQIVPPPPTNPSESTMDLEYSGAVPSARIVTQHPQLFASSGKETPLMKFYKGEPLALGITQLSIGILGIAFGVVLDLANYYTSGYIVAKTPYWTGIPVKGMLGMNILSAIAAGFGIVILSVSLAFSHLSWYGMNLCSHLDAKQFRQCYENEVIFQVSACRNPQEWALHPSG